jgi:phospho-N-acetylmuramoyl-pentapeptide-transferase
MVISIVAGPKFIDFLRRNEFGQQIREEGPQGHVVKRGTPAMGGLLIMLAMAIPFLAFSKHTLPALTAFFVTLGCAAIGFVDDWTKISRRRSLGLAGRWKLVWLAGITVIVGLVVSDRGFSTSVYVPLIDVDIPLSYAWYVLAFFIIAGAANGVNLTDGVDGLAAGTTTIAILTYTAMSLVAALTAVRRGAPADPTHHHQANHRAPELLLLLIGGIFLVEALSVILQVLTFKWFGRRIFLMAPLHHHFEMKAWSETRITVRFWIATAILCACGFVLYYAYFSNFNNLAS